MATSMRLLLRLPPAIRQQVLCTPLPSSTCSNIHGITISLPSRHFSIAPRLNKQGGKTKATYKNALPQAPTPQARNLPKPQPAPAPLISASDLPPKPLPPKLTPLPKNLAPPPEDWMSTRFRNQDHVLLYAAPNHTAFFLSSLTIGTLLLAGCYSYAEMVLKDPPANSERPKLPYIIKGLGGLTVVLVAAFSTYFLLAPMKMIKSITAIRQPAAHHIPGRIPWDFRVSVKRIMPFAKAKVLEVPLQDFALDRNLPVASGNVGFISHPIRDAEWFTAAYFMGKLETKQGSALSRFNRSLINIWPGITREVRRMFLRDHMAYVRIKGSGNFKLDVQNCHMLEGGQILHKLVKVDADAKAGSAWRAMLVRILGDKNEK
ncbi:hypothetical protein CKM354_000239700 [Cercospora kikuchii]|uniref:Uncharacterized protein n=1 Tax=Cercospora kikuchii TaxID=84275 RepID=A0A9P3C9T1_9PEZI|nr:uncharacterized protein CKM354_000239700 [Cercospora kikuchii]GIZ39004.1 hypothetical protein CKM354_000239700 [Cercospora kikuchii]